MSLEAWMVVVCLCSVVSVSAVAMVAIFAAGNAARAHAELGERMSRPFADRLLSACGNSLDAKHAENEEARLRPTPPAPPTVAELVNPNMPTDPFTKNPYLNNPNG